MDERKRTDFFCRLQAELDNPTYAAIRAGYSVETAAHIASTLMADPRVKEAIDSYRARLKRDREADVDKVKEKLAAMINYDLGAIVEEDGSMKNIKDMTPEEAMMIAGVKVKESFNPETGEVVRNIEYKLTDRLKSADMFLRIEGAYKEADGRNITVNVINPFDKSDILDTVPIEDQDGAQQDLIEMQDAVLDDELTPPEDD